MSTSMITNWKKLNASKYELVDPMIGSLMYLVNTRPDICFVVNTLSQFMVEPRRVHWVASKHVLKYLQGTMDYGLDYVGGDQVSLIGYKDSYWEYECPRNNREPSQLNPFDGINHIFTVSPRVFLNITSEHLEESKREATRRARMEVINNLDEDSREKLKKK